MGTYRILLVIICLLSFSSAQQPASPLYKLEGTVINGLDGKPLPRVLVQCTGHAVLTGPEGEFSLDGLPAGRMQVAATKPGYFSPGAKVVRWSPGKNVDVGPDTGKVVLKLLPEAVIFGSVTGKDEEPLEGAGVLVFTFLPTNGRQQLAPAGNFNVRTDEDGNFRIAGLPAGRYYVAVKAGSVTRRILGAQTARSDEAYPPIVYYPATQDLAAALPVNLLAGQRMEAKFSLAPVPAFKIAGTVTAAGEWKQVNPPMIVDDMEQVLFTPVEFDPQSGAFQFRAVPAGTYTFRLGGMDQQDRYVSSLRKITISRPVTGLKLTLRPGIDVPVVVRNEFSKKTLPGNCTYSVPGGELHQSDCSDYPVAHVELAADSGRSRFYSEYGPMKDPSNLTLHGVMPGKYVVRAQANFGGYVRSLRSGNTDLLREELVVPESGNVPPIEVAVRDDAATLKVQVHTEKPGQQATVVLYPDGAVVAEPQMITSTTNTEFQTGPVAPGTYKVFAFDSIDGLDYANREEIMDRYASSAATVTVAPNGSASVTVDLIHTGD